MLDLTTQLFITMSAAATESTSTPTFQAKTGLVMPISKIKTDNKEASGCKQMSVDAAVVIAAALKLLTLRVTKEAIKNRRKGESSIAAEVLRDVLLADPVLVSVLGPNPVFIIPPSTRKSKPKVDKEGEAEIAGKAKAAEGEDEPKPKKRKAAKEPKEPKEEGEEEPKKVKKSKKVKKEE